MLFRELSHHLQYPSTVWTLTVWISLLGRYHHYPNLIPHSTTQCHTVPHSTTQCHTGALAPCIGSQYIVSCTSQVPGGGVYLYDCWYHALSGTGCWPFLSCGSGRDRPGHRDGGTTACYLTGWLTSWPGEGLVLVLLLSTSGSLLFPLCPAGSGRRSSPTGPRPCLPPSRLPQPISLSPREDHGQGTIPQGPG